MKQEFYNQLSQTDSSIPINIKQQPLVEIYDAVYDKEIKVKHNIGRPYSALPTA